ncbi:MAG: efflux RND transporter periplasmic adaptor subunit [Thermoanaerobaculia bacterium]
MRSVTPLSTALLLAALAAPVLAQATPPPVPVEVTDVRSAPMASSVRVPGSVVSRHDARIAAEVSGRLTWVAAGGDRGGAREPLARIDDEAVRLQLRTDEATIKRLEANLSYLEAEVARLERLTREQVVAANQLEQTSSQAEAARQELEAARVGRDQTLFRLERSQIAAPFGGQVVERLAQPGGFVSTGIEVVRLVDTRNVEVSARAPLSVAPYLREGQTVVVEDGGRRTEAVVRTLAAVGDERSRTFEVRLTPRGEPWLVGTAVRAVLPASEPRDVLAVPRDALVLRAEEAYLFRLAGDDTVERVTVTTGIAQGPLIAVEGALSAGDRVVVRGAERLRPGQQVTVRAQAM